MQLNRAFPKKNHVYTKYELRNYQICSFLVQVSCIPRFAVGDCALNTKRIINGLEFIIY